MGSQWDVSGKVKSKARQSFISGSGSRLSLSTTRVPLSGTAASDESLL